MELRCWPYDGPMSQKLERSELNYVIAGAILVLGGGYIVNFAQDEDSTPGVIVGAILLVLGIVLLIRGFTRGRRS
jgi:uncharacterized membrane protein HdeD (DUF308 family)